MGIRILENTFGNGDVRFRKDWVALEEISPNMPLAVIASEDQLFLEHNGFDVKAIEKAINYNSKKKGKKVRGASTISQQTAKNVFLWPGRSWVRKGLEVYFTFLIETIWSKKRIIEVYLNIAEMGNGIYGVEAASQYYYKKAAKDLKKKECAAITSILPLPLKRNPLIPEAQVAYKQQWILRQMENLRPTVKFEQD